MKPNFALGLTDDGITLWQHDAGEWWRVGAVALDAPDMDDQVQALVATAKSNAVDEVITKLVIPDDQILYTQLPATTSPDDIREALHGKTPYAVDELEFDSVVAGDDLHVAVVARETLAEAEDFAKENGLNPVCFVAAPDGSGFAKEPFFGLARAVRATAPDIRPDNILRESGPLPVKQPTLSAIDASPTTQSAAPVDEKPATTEPGDPPSNSGAKDLTPAVAPAVSDPQPASDSKATSKPESSPAPASVEAVGFRSRRVSENTGAQPAPNRPTKPDTASRASVKPTTKPVSSRAPTRNTARQVATRLLPGTGVVTRLRAARTALKNPIRTRAAAAQSGSKASRADAAAQAKSAPVPPRAPSLTKTMRTAPATGKSGTDPEAERLTVFGARRNTLPEPTTLPRRALLISGGALLLVLAVGVWVFYFTRASEPELAQPVLPEDSVAEIAAPDALALPDGDTAGASAGDAQQVEAALGLADAAEQRGAQAAAEAESETPAGVASDTGTPSVAAPAQDAGRLAALRSVRAIAPEGRGTLPDVQAAPAPFGTTPLPPLRGAVTAPPPDADAPDIAGATLPPGEAALEIAVTQGPPAATPPVRPEGLAPTPPPDPATLDESALVIDVTDGAPPSVPPDRPVGIAPEPPADALQQPEGSDTGDSPASAQDEDQASLTPPPGGVSLDMLTPAARPAAVVEQAAARAERFASATPQAVAASLRPSNRPSGFSQIVQRALAAARDRQSDRSDIVGPRRHRSHRVSQVPPL